MTLIHCAIRNTFKAYERLKREQHIDTLFRKGKAFSVFPVKCIYTTAPRGAETSPVKVGFSVPKKKFKHSVDRHRVRRLMFEAWRLQKGALYPAIPPDIQLHIFLLHTATEMPTQETITISIGKLISKLGNNFAAKNE
ncbi:MAG: hypothetical protein EOP51_15415 [Sphingobacteriales bacterium]|nr:MAG: hypothetical protein EOP51_15415 [Sphingobacteriales bacterium]